MVSPIYLIILALGTAFLLPLIWRISSNLSRVIFFLTLAAMAVLAISYLPFLGGNRGSEVFTAGFRPPVSINLRMGAEESFAISAVLLAAFLGAFQLMPFWKKNAGNMMVYLSLALGVSGIIMTRDLFNLFVFLEITAMSSYGLIALAGDRRALEGGFKYLMAGGLSSIFFLLGTIYIYRFTGTLNLDGIIQSKASITGIGGAAAMFFLLGAVLIELKPFPANGWALDVYESAPEGVAGIIASASAGAMIFALYKILPLLPLAFLRLVVGIGFLSFFAGNLIALKQQNVRRMLGYSSTSQIGLLAGALGVLFLTKAQPALLLVIAGGIFINHLLAKAGLFWIAGQVRESSIKGWAGRLSSSFAAHILGILVLALAGLPPFPGFWAKWMLIRVLLQNGQSLWIVLILAASLFEIIYLTRWFIAAVRPVDTESQYVVFKDNARGINEVRDGILPAGLLLALGLMAGKLSGGLEFPVFLILAAGLGFYLLDALPSRLKAILAMAVIGLWAWFQIPGLSGLNLFFFGIFTVGSIIHLFASMYRKESRKGFYPLMVGVSFSLGALVLTRSNLAFFTAWEMLAICSWFLILRGRKAEKASLVYFAFSMGGAYVLMVGLLLMDMAASPAAWIFILVGLLVKIGALGVHIWLPGAYGEAEDDFSSFLSSVLSKAGIFALLVFAVRFLPIAGSGISPVLIGWLGALTALIATLIAAFQEDIKYTLAWSSMGQIGYIILAFSLMNHAGWTTALYLTLNHSIFKGMLFLAVAGIILRTGTRQMYQMGGLIKKMPISFLTVLMAIIAVSGVPPLSGFGGKWLLYTSLIESGRPFQAGMAFFSSTMAFLYLFRLIHTMFLGQLKREHQTLKEAPLWLIIPQVLLMGGLMFFSMYPAIFVEPMSAIAAKWFPAAINFNKGTVMSAMGYWNGSYVMYVTMGVFAVPLIMLLLGLRKPQKVSQFNIVFASERPESPETTHFAYNFFAPYRKALGFMGRSHIRDCWNRVFEAVDSSASMIRRFYTGNGQTYMIHIMLFLTLSWFILRGLS